MLTTAIDEIIAAVKRSGKYALDYETTGLNPKTDRIISASFAVGEDGWCLPFVGQGALPFRETMDALKPMMTNTDYSPTTHNGKFEYECTWAAGYDIKGDMFDTMIGAWTLDESLAGSEELSLRSLALVECGIKLAGYEEFSKQGELGLGGPSIETKGLEDARATLALRRKFEPKLKKDERLWKFFRELAMPVVRVIAEMEMTGVVIDLPWMWELKKRLTTEAKEIEKKIHTLAGRPLMVSSPEQVSQYLFGDLKLKPKPFMEAMPQKFVLKKPGINGTVLWSSKEEVLSEYGAECEVADLVLSWRGRNKLESTNVSPFIDLAAADPENRIRTHFWQTGTESGRLSSSDPVNLQNIPREKNTIRRAMAAAANHVLIAADYNQLELRLMAHFSRDPQMMDAYMTGKDIHGMTQKDLGIPERVVAKNCNFGLIYGMAAPRLQKELWVKARVRTTLNDCERWRVRFFDKYKGVVAYHKAIEEQLKANGYVRSILGRYRRLKKFMQEDFSGAFRVGLNFTIQGSAADLALVAMRNFQREIEAYRLKDERWTSVHQVLQVHDAIVAEAPAAIGEEVLGVLKKTMEGAIRLSTGIPILVNVGMGVNWQAAEEDAKKREKAA